MFLRLSCTRGSSKELQPTSQQQQWHGDTKQRNGETPPQILGNTFLACNANFWTNETKPKDHENTPWTQPCQ